MGLLEIIADIMVTLAVAGGWSYADGRATRQFNSREREQHPPYKIGIVTAPIWPVQILFGLFFLAVIAPHRKGEQRSLVRDEELTALRKQNRELNTAHREIMREIAAGADPSTDEGLLSLTKSSVSRETTKSDLQLADMLAAAREEPSSLGELLDRHNRPVGGTESHE